MATDIYSDDNGQRVVIRHLGPPGPGLPPGGTTGQLIVKASTGDFDFAWQNAPNGTGAAVGPNVAVDGNFALFDGTTGKLLKDSGRSLSYYATQAYATTKVDKVTGKGLSTEDFTTVEKAKLATLSISTFAGVFADIEDAPSGAEGSYAIVEGVDSAKLYIWDETNTIWTEVTGQTMSAEAIAAVLYNGTDVYDQTANRTFTTADRATLDSLATLNTSALARYGAVSYFSLTGTAVTISGVSDGSTNMVKASVVTTLDTSTTGFDAGSADARLRHTGTTVKVFFVRATLSVSGAATDTLVVGIAKNGNVVAASKSLVKMSAGGDAVTLVVSTLASLTTNDYVEVFVGNTTDTSAPQILSLNLSATSA